MLIRKLYSNDNETLDRGGGFYGYSLVMIGKFIENLLQVYL